MSTNKRPTHRILAVTSKRNSDNADWKEIGAAWPNRKGNGFYCRFSLFPTHMSEADIVIVEIDEAADAARRNRQHGEPSEFAEGLPN